MLNKYTSNYIINQYKDRKNYKILNKKIRIKINKYLKMLRNKEINLEQIYLKRIKIIIVLLPKN